MWQVLAMKCIVSFSAFVAHEPFSTVVLGYISTGCFDGHVISAKFFELDVSGPSKVLQQLDMNKNLIQMCLLLYLFSRDGILV